MKTKFNHVPHYKQLNYIYNAETGLYTCNEIDALKPPYNALTTELIKEPATITNVNPQPVYRLRSSRYKTGEYGFITSLFKIDFTNWFVGSHYRIDNGHKVVNTMIARYTFKPRGIQLFYFIPADNYGLYDRIEFANCIIPHLPKSKLII